ncbi:SigB/SigF/SigG family RNA polymerase sigma factor [uncultured Subdoligranulum sp.]|uniref:SigB/SigF/SigG family RNA polymerase sigma factor n=1 Tax=uncultured Subdoligranulum sp. TaxID=512298 RepID=UPI00263A2ABC|nr:SigB/SigF/SigG family RNA polymerase sigma factor [uncultured Subdoligranulum sp.]
MYAGKVELCGVDTSQLPVLSETEKSALIRAARAGDAGARQKMIQGNLRLVLSVVQKFSNRGENPDDLFQVGCIGLIKAIDNFDPDLQVRFSTYGVPMIVGEIRRFLRDNNAVRVSRSIRDLAYHSMRAREALQKENGREPKISEIAARVGSSPENVAMALESVVEPASLYEPVYSDGEDSFAIVDQLRDATGEESWISDIMFRDTVKSLSARERRIIAMRYLGGKTQMQVAREIGISQAQVSRLEKGALNHIKEQISSSC